MTLRLDKLSVSIRNRVILRDVSVSFPKGLSYLVGLNGCGKTTLLRCISQLLPYQGDIWLEDQPLKQFSPKMLARQLAVVPQHLNIPFKVKVYDFVLMGRFPYLNWLGNYQSTDHDSVRKSLTELQIEDLSTRNLDEISGGELQKVCIARALSQDTPVLLLDEPSQSLDPKNKAILYQQLETLGKSGKTLICVTHDLEPLNNPDVQVIGLRAGEVIIQSKGGEIKNRLMEEVY